MMASVALKMNTVGEGGELLSGPSLSPLLSATSGHQLADDGRFSILERLEQPSPWLKFTLNRRRKSGGAKDCSYLLICH